MEYMLHGSDVTSMHAAIPLSTRRLNEGWSVWFILNRKHSRDGVDHSFQLLPIHFGKRLPTESFFRELEKIDPDWRDNCRTHPTETFMDKNRKILPMANPANKKMYDALDKGDIHAFETAFLNPPANTKHKKRKLHTILEQISENPRSWHMEILKKCRI